MIELKENASSKLKRSYSTYVKQLSTWTEDGAIPEHVSQDVRCALELQRKHWQTLGLDVHHDIQKIKGDASRGAASVSYSDKVFINHIVVDNKELTTTIHNSNGEIYRKTMNIGLPVVIQELKEGAQPPSDMTMNCPNCGAPATVAQIENGCPYCGTHFIMKELYPKVVNYFFEKLLGQGQKKNYRELITFILVSTVLMLVIGPFLWPADSSVFNSIISSIICGAIIGFSVFCLYKMLEVFAHIGKSFQGAEKTGKSAMFALKLRKIDPDFSSEYFRDRAMHLFRMIAYSEDPGVYTACECGRPESWETIVDASLHRFGVDQYRIEGQECTVSVTLYLDCLIYNNGRIKSKGKKVHMTLRKEITAPTDLGFSVKAVNCSSCGGSFDAEQVKRCPYCGHDYDLSRHDWIVTDIR